MTRIGFHASHEQFAPSRLLRLARLAEEAGFDAIKSSDHFHPWSERQGQSGFAWSWLGAAMQATNVPFGIISAPGDRYHPAVLAQAAATIGEMFPDRLWLALGSGEHINESITGSAWPDKAERNARLAECAAITRALFAGETVTHRGRVTVVGAKLWSRPARPVPLYAAAVSEETARLAGSWADGLLTTGGRPDAVRKVFDAFRDGGGEGKPLVIQAALCWAPSREEAEAEVLHQWRHAALAGDAVWDIRRPKDFDDATRSATAEQLSDAIPVSANLQVHAEWIESLLELHPAELHLHQVGRNQEAFVASFGERILPELSIRSSRNADAAE